MTLTQGQEVFIAAVLLLIMGLLSGWTQRFFKWMFDFSEEITWKAAGANSLRFLTALIAGQSLAGTLNWIVWTW